MKHNISLLALVLALGMLIGLMGGCGGNVSSTPDEVEAVSADSSAPEVTEVAPAPEASQSVPERVEEASVQEPDPQELEPVSLPIVDEEMRVSLWSIIRPQITAYVQTTEDIYLYKVVRERTNIAFDAQLISLDAATEKFTLMAASGDFTDVVQDINYYSSGVNGALEDEVIYDLYDYVMDYAPHYWNTISSNSEALTTLINQDGQMGALATLYKEPGLEATGLCVRGDWMEEFGLDEIVTYDDLHEYLAQAAEKKGVGMSLASDGQCFELSQGYGVIAGAYSTYDDQVKHFVETDGYYDYLVMLNQWYREGLIDQDFVSQSGLAALGEMFIQDKSSVGEFHAAAMVGLNGIASDPNAVYVSIPNAKQNPDDEYTIGKTNSILKDPYTWAISTKCDPEKIPALIQLVDYFYSDEGILLYNYGTEGYTFDFDAEGNPVFTELITNNEQYDANTSLVIYISATIPSVFDQAREYYDLSDLGWQAIETFSSQNIGINVLPDNISAFLTNEETTELAKISGDVDTLVESTVLSFITADSSPSRDNYDAFVQTCISMGMDQMDAIYQTAYDRYLESANLAA